MHIKGNNYFESHKQHTQLIYFTAFKNKVS
ncbi:Uncharacterised protein [Providencia rettgeri]|uniref:Uncharacterized protein n=1 Tax=Providencia rettgeri TaxID=587 RepID=A0A379FKN9_PRORE|nr:Uncharacterised protein [Providencia rettgeri]